MSEDSPSAGWTSKEAQIVECVLSKHVVGATYRDAVFRGLLSRQAAAEEMQTIFEKYDTSIAALLGNGEADETGTS